MRIDFRGSGHEVASHCEVSHVSRRLSLEGTANPTLSSLKTDFGFLPKRAAATTITAAMVGFSAALVVSYVATRYKTGKGRYDVVHIVQGTLGAIVSVTGTI